MKNKVAKSILVLSILIYPVFSFAHQVSSESDIQSRTGLAGAVIGGIGGAAGYGLHTVIGGNRFSPATLALAAASGAKEGATSGPLDLIWKVKESVGSGIAHGLIDRFLL